MGRGAQDLSSNVLDLVAGTEKTEIAGAGDGIVNVMQAEHHALVDRDDQTSPKILLGDRSRFAKRLQFELYGMGGVARAQLESRRGIRKRRDDDRCRLL